MYLHRMRYIAIIFFLLDCNANALPSVEFIRDFAKQHHRSSVVLHVPDNLPIIDCMNWYVKVTFLLI